MTKKAKTPYHIIQNFKELKILVKLCKKAPLVSLDFESTGVKRFNKDFKPTILTVTFQAGSSIIIPLQHHERTEAQQIEGMRWLQYFGKHIVSNPKVTKAAWNYKFDGSVFKRYGIYTRGTIIDAMLAKYILNEEKPNDLKSMVVKYIPKFSGYEKADNFDELPWDRKPFDRLCEYAAIDTDATFQLAVFFEKKLMENNFYPLYRNLIMSASQVLMEAEYHGLPIDIELNKDLDLKYSKLIEESYNDMNNLIPVRKFQMGYNKSRVKNYIAKLEAELEALKEDEDTKPVKISNLEKKLRNLSMGIYSNKKEKSLNDPINFGSTQQLVEFLYTHKKGLKLPIIEYTKNKNKKNKSDKKNPSTSEDTLLKLKKEDKSGFIDFLLKLRGYEHIYSTFIKGYQEFIQDDGRIHGSFHIHGTVTGRLSSSKPNLQQIPKKEVNPDIKKQYIALKDHLYFAYDYSQAELRMMAHLSQDEVLLEAFAKGQDPHLAIACIKYKTTYEKAYKIYKDETHKDYKTWKVRRKQAKQIVFGTIYGIEALKLSQQLSDYESGIIITEKQAQQFLDEFFDEHPKVRAFIDNQGELMEENGYVSSIFGRRRRCPTIYSDKIWLYNEALRQAVNAPCQSAGSDMALFASVLIFNKMRKGDLPYMPEVSTVHDALYHFSLPKFLNPWTIYQIHKICKNPSTHKYFGFRIDDISMEVDFSVGRTMAEELPFIPGYDYTKMLSKDFSLDEYYAEQAKVKNIALDDYPKAFPQYFTKEFKKQFKNEYQDTFNKLNLCL